METHLHFLGMNINVHPMGIHLNHQYNKGKFVYHGMPLIALFDGFGDNTVPEIPAIDKIMFVITVTSGNHRLTHKAPHPDSIFLPVCLQQVHSHIPAEYMIDGILDVAITGCGHLILVVADKLKGNIRAAQGQPLHKGLHIAGLSHFGF